MHKGRRIIQLSAFAQDGLIDYGAGRQNDWHLAFLSCEPPKDEADFPRFHALRAITKRSASHRSSHGIRGNQENNEPGSILPTN